MKCTFLGCEAYGDHKLTPQYGPPSRWCRTHGLATYEVALQFANRQTSAPRLTPGVPLRLPRPVKEATAS